MRIVKRILVLLCVISSFLQVKGQTFIAQDSIINKEFKNISLPDQETQYLVERRSTTFKHVRFIGRTHFRVYNFPDIQLDSCTFDDLHMSKAGFDKLNIIGCTMNKLDFKQDTVRRRFFFSDDSIRGNADFSNSTFKERVIFRGARFGPKVSFKGSTFLETFVMRDVNLPDTIDLQDANLSEMKADLDLTSFNPTHKKCMINLYGIDIHKVRLRMTNFALYFPKDKGLTFEDTAYVYQQLLDKLSDGGLLDSYRDLDVQYKQLKYYHSGNRLGNWIDRVWWYYGYNKALIVKNALLLFLFFLFINLLIYDKLFETYPIQNFAEAHEHFNKLFSEDRLKYLWHRFMNCFMYTCFIFWTLKLDVGSFNLRNRGLFAYIIFQFMCGLICLAYIANMVLSK